MTSVVIAAHNEAHTIGACLDALLADAEPGELDVTVVANGCQDDTASIARSRDGVRVLDLPEPGKAAALNAADAVARGFPRIYLDADIVVPTSVARALRDALEGAPGTRLAAFPRRHLELAGRPWPVRAYFAVNNRLPVFETGLFGRGMIALAEEGRARFDTFPELVADDLFLDSLFAPGEKYLVEEVSTTVAAPYRTSDLVRRLVRVRRGNAAMRLAAREELRSLDVRAADRWSWWRDVVRVHPRLAPAAAVYVAITVSAALRARLTREGAVWERDLSTRTTEGRPGR